MRRQTNLVDQLSSVNYSLFLMNMLAAKGLIKLQQDNIRNMPSMAPDTIIILIIEILSAHAQIRCFKKKCNLEELSALPYLLKHYSQ